MLSLRLNAQLMIEQGPSASTRDGGIYIYGLTGQENKLRYEKINGSPFLDEAWKNATLYDSQGNSFGKFKVRLNLAKHEVHYLDNGDIKFAVHLNDGYYTHMKVTTREVAKSDCMFSTGEDEVLGLLNLINKGVNNND